MSADADGRRPPGVGDENRSKTIFSETAISVFGAGFAQLLGWIAGGAETSDLSWPTKAYALIAGVVVVINWIAFIPACIVQTEKFYDLVGSITHLSLIWLSFYLGLNPNFEGVGFDISGINSDRQLALSILYTIWAVRLGTYLAWRGHKYGDRRFDQIKTIPERFFTFWTIQGVWAFLTGIGVIIVNISDNPRARSDLGPADFVGFALFGLGIVIEAVADLQKTIFKLNPDNKGKWIESGLWYYSRHPNYYGEIMCWIGCFISVASIASDGEWVIVASPLFITFLLYRVTGIPTLESKADERWGDDPDYIRYKQVTWELVILPRKRAPAGY